jgi:nitrite reductase/ring-hydroxylating ferredoxin subunit
VLTCPWHGYQYDVTTGQLLTDPSARLEMYTVEIRDGELHLLIPTVEHEPVAISVADEEETAAATDTPGEGVFPISELKPGQSRLLTVNGEGIVVYNVDGAFYATQAQCSHQGGPLAQGELEGKVVTCPVHGACFDVSTGQVLCRPARQPLKTFRVTVDGEMGRIEGRQ